MMSHWDTIGYDPPIDEGRDGDLCSSCVATYTDNHGYSGTHMSWPNADGGGSGGTRDGNGRRPC